MWPFLWDLTCHQKLYAGQLKIVRTKFECSCEWTFYRVGNLKQLLLNLLLYTYTEVQDCGVQTDWIQVIVYWRTNGNQFKVLQLAYYT